MNNQNFALRLAVACSLALLAGLGSGRLLTHSAFAYPAGQALSLGTNPVDAKGGVFVAATSNALLYSNTGPGDFVITDVVFGSRTVTDCVGMVPIALLLSPPTDHLAHFAVPVARGDSQSFPGVLQHHFSSGLSIPAGSALEVTATTPSGTGSCGGASMTYTLSGYRAKP